MHEVGAGRPATDRIRVTGITATGHHGVFEHEKRDGQTFVADVVLHVDTRAAAAQDALGLTTDYGVLAERVVGVLEGQPADLIETVAERIAAVAMDLRGVLGVDVVLHKPQAPITVPFADVTVEIHRHLGNPPVVPSTPVPALFTAPAPSAPAVPAAGPAVTAAAGRAPDPLDPDWFADVRGRHEDPVEAGPAGATALGATGAGAGAGAVAGGVAGPGDAGAVPAVGADATADAVADGPALDDTVAMPVADALTGPLPVAVDAHTSDAPAGDLPDGASTAAGAVVDDEDRLATPPTGPVDVVLSLGSNVGASHETLRQVVLDLGAVGGIDVTAIAPLARTGAVGGPEQPDFLNTVVLATTSLSPRALLRAVQEIENAHGRVREERWGPRTIDIDIITYGTTVAAAADLELPHPRAHERAFVLEPWAQVDPDAVLPGLGGGPVARLAGTAPDRGGIRWMALDWWAAPEAGAR